jgi:hypothetical protein
LRAGGRRQKNLAVCRKPLDISATIEDAVNDNERRRDVKGDGDAPFKPNDPQPWPQLIPPDATFGKGVKR